MPKNREGKAMAKPTRLEKLAYLDAALKYVDSFRMAIDAGAHWGLWAEVMAKQFQHVVCFEPLPENQIALKERMAQFDNVTLYNAALGEHCGNGTLLDPIKAGGHSKHYVDFGKGETPVFTIDSCNLEDVDFIKVDCEGADLLVLKGGIETIKECRPVIIVERLVRFEARYNIQENDIPSFMGSLGYIEVEHHWRDVIYCHESKLRSVPHRDGSSPDRRKSV
jgi:FkbM family methyltransferase